MSTALQIGSRKQRAIRHAKREAFLLEGNPPAWDAPESDIDEYTQLFVEPEFEKIRVAVAMFQENDETVGKFYELMNCDLDMHTDAWKARQLESVIADCHDNARMIGQDEVAS